MWLAISLLSTLPVGSGRVDRTAAGRAMTVAPAVGALLGALAAIVALLADGVGLGRMLAATLGIGTLAVLTRGLHLDGLADTADGLGSGRGRDGALEVMRRSDIGPFGVVTVVLVLLVDISALAELVVVTPLYGGAAVVVAAATGRCAATLACRPSVPAARPDGLGALVAGSVGRREAALAVIATSVLSAGLLAGAAAASGGAPVAEAAGQAVAAVVVGLAATLLLERRCRRRLGGVTGDVLGALVETAQAVALLVLVIG